MSVFQPRELLRVLGAHQVRYVVVGNLGATLYGSPVVTTDLDICPARDDANYEALAAALRELSARIRTGDAAEGIPFACDATFLRQMRMINLTTPFGDVDVAFEPAGTGGFGDLIRRAVTIDLRDGLSTTIASLEDIVRSKEAANREKDRLALPTLRLLLEKRRQTNRLDP